VGPRPRLKRRLPKGPNVVFILADDLDKRLLVSDLDDYPNIRASA
jgi:hypothetical protein